LCRPTTQLLTVSSQIKNPITVGGRILDGFMEIYAISVIAGLAGAIGSFLQKTRPRDRRKTLTTGDRWIRAVVHRTVARILRALAAYGLKRWR